MFLKKLRRKLCSKMSGNQTTAPRVPARISSSNTNLLDSTRNGLGAGDPEDVSTLAHLPSCPSFLEGTAFPAPMSLERRLPGDGWGDSSVSSSGSQSARVILNCTGTEMENHLDKILECPVCFEVILPPIQSCVEGHCWCESCHTALQRCPVCRGEILGVRNLLIEQFLEKCRFKCKFHTLGCTVVLSAKDLAIHCRRECPLRPIHCSECNLLVSFDEYLDHLRTQDKIQQHSASECSTGFEIDDNDFYDPPSRRSAVWEPTWLNCYGENFLTFLEYNGNVWWIWVASLTELGCTHRCQTTLWNKEIRSEITFKGRIHPIRSNAFDVLSSGECLILTASTLRKFVYRRGIDVLVRIEREYEPPRTRRGSEVQSPLVAARGSSAGGSRSAGTSAQPSATPTRASPGTVVESRNQTSNYQRSGAGTRSTGSTVSSNGRRVLRTTPEQDRLRRSGCRRPTANMRDRLAVDQPSLILTPDASHRNTRRRGLAARGPFGHHIASVMSSMTGREIPVAEEEEEEEEDNSEDMEPAEMEMDGEYDENDVDGADIDDDNAPPDVQDGSLD